MITDLLFSNELALSIHYSINENYSYIGNLYGNCCDKNCGGWEGGRPAIEHAAEGLFDNAPVTEWVRGQPAEVQWRMTAEHRGGYAYRLCKVSFPFLSFHKLS